ncbi:MAG: DNA helicase, partial [Alphaproteobacteria bacterium]|nr:DNA helicase [Alphaproteobacteria bacterium]
VLITWEGAPIGRLRRGASALRPLAEAADSAYLDGAQRERIRVRLQRYGDARVRAGLAPLFTALTAADPTLRGVLHRLGEAIGVIAAEVEPVSAPLRARLKAIGVEAGRQGIFMPVLLKPGFSPLRALLWGVHTGVAVPELPPSARVSLPVPAEWPVGFAAAMGWIEAGPVLVRLDVAERVGGDLAAAARERPIPMPVGLATRLAVKAEQLPPVLRRLGFRVLPALPLSPGEFGPPAPPMLAPLRPKVEPVAATPARAAGPFAALAVLQAR